jgi:hypothetical protein
MSIRNTIRDLGSRLKGASWIPTRAPKEVPAHYEKYRNLVRSLRPKAERTAFTERDPRVNLLIEEGVRNVYFIQFVLAGDGVEDVVEERLVLRNEILSHVRDEFERSESLSRFEEALEAQRQLILRKNFYIELDLPLPEFDFEKKHFELEFSGLLSNRSIALHDLLFVWDVNLRGFHPIFRFRFDSADEARDWKARAEGMRLGIVYHVVTQTPRLWDSGMPATICYVVGFAFVDGRTGDVLEPVPVQVTGLPGPHDKGPKNRAQIVQTVQSMLDKL